MKPEVHDGVAFLLTVATIGCLVIWVIVKLWKRYFARGHFPLHDTREWDDNWWK